MTDSCEAFADCSASNNSSKSGRSSGSGIYGINPFSYAASCISLGAFRKSIIIPFTSIIHTNGLSRSMSGVHHSGSRGMICSASRMILDFAAIVLFDNPKISAICEADI